MNHVLKKSFSLFFALTLVFSPLGTLFTPKAEAQIAGAAAGCASGFVISEISSFFGMAVPVDDKKNNYKECMDAIAFALAKTLLAEFTNSIINWINTGFDGNPFYIGDTGSYFTNVIRDELQLALNDLQQTGTIFFDILRDEAIYRARATLHDQFEFTLDTDIIRGLCGYAEYQAQEFCTSQLTPESRSELAQAFTRGYIPFQWSTWDSLTQNCGNNTFCASTAALNYQLAQRREQLQQVNDDLNRGSGFLSQKVCKDPGFQRDLEDWYEEVGSASFVGTASSTSTGSGGLFGDPLGLESGRFRPRPVCREEIIQTPGRIIADKLTSNLGTTERQYELADELNEAVAAIFNALIEKLISDGLSSFNDDGEGDYYEMLAAGNSGFGYDSTVDSLNQNAEACERAGGVYDPDLEVCDTDAIPNFPWTMDDGTVVTNEQGFNALITANPETCIEIDSVRVHEGAEPCITGVSGGGTTGGLPPYPWTMGDGTVIADDADFADLIIANIGSCILIDNFTVNEGAEPCITGVSGGGTVTTNTLTINPNPLVVGGLATFTLSNVSPDTEFEVLYTPTGESSPRFLIAGLTEANGTGVVSIQIPNITTSQVLITVDIGGETIDKLMQVSR